MSAVVRRSAALDRPKLRRAVRVSYSALLRIADDDRYVLFHTSSRPGAYSPPGGVYKYFAPATVLLEGLGFVAERRVSRAHRARSDLRGLLPAGSLRHFRRWFACGAYREDAQECLRRELIEELEEVGFPELGADVGELEINHVRTVVETAQSVPGKDYGQERRFEVYDLMDTNGASAWLRKRLVELGADPGVSTVINASAAQMAYGRAGHALIAPHTPFLVGSRRTMPDLPAMP